MHDPCEPDERLARLVGDAYRSTPGTAPERAAEARARLDRALASEPRPRRTRGGAFGSWFTPRLWLVRPAFAAAAIVVALGAGVIVGRVLGLRAADESPASVATHVTRAHDAPVVEFVLVAPSASRVSVVGDFNAWDPVATPLVAQGDGSVWSVRVPLDPGRHVYSFVIDGKRWVSDPVAPLEPANELGFRNSVVVVEGLPPS